MPIVLPLLTPDSPYFEFQTVIEDVTYTFTMRWNTRDSSWFMDWSDEAGNVIVGGVKIVVDFPLAARCQDPRLPKGSLFAIDTTGQRADPGVNDLGDRVALLYFTVEELLTQPVIADAESA